VCTPEQDGELFILDTHKPTGDKERLSTKGLLDTLGFSR